MIRPNVLDLVASPATLGVFRVSRRLAGARLHVVGDPREQPVNLATIRPMEAEPVVARKCLGLRTKAAAQCFRQFLGRLPPDITHDQEHGVLHRGVVDRTPVPDSLMNKNVEIRRYDANLAQRARLVVVHTERREERRVLKREVVLRIEVNALKTRRQRLRRAAQPLVPSAVKSEISLNESSEIGAPLKGECLLVVANPPVELRANQIEILRDRAALPLPDRLSVLTSQPRLDAVSILILAE